MWVLPFQGVLECKIKTMKLFYTLLAVCYFTCTSYGQCYSIITLTNASEIDCTGGFVTLQMNFQSANGAGNACVIVSYTTQNGEPASENYPNLSGPTDVTLANVDCTEPITLTPRTAKNCNGTNCAEPITYDDVEDWIMQTLPISLHSFSVEETKDHNALVKWATSSEVDNDFFLIERSANGKAWEAIGRVAGSGNSSTLIDYEFTDRSTLKGKSYYRLIDVDYAGNETASHVVSFNNRGLEIGFTAYPNPVKDDLSLDKLELNDEVSIFSQDGKLILKEEVNETNFYNFKVDLSIYNSGVFMIRLIRGQEVYTDRIVKN
jgi:hypothetical protein